MTLAEKRIIQGEIKRLKESGCASPLSVLDDLDVFVENLAEESVEPDFQKHAEIWLNYFVERNDSVKRKLVYETAKEFAKWQREQLNKVYILVGYKAATEPYGPQDSDILGYCFTKEKCKELHEKLTDKYIPKYLDHSICSIIGWKFKGKFEDFLKNRDYILKDVSDEELRKDWDKCGRSTEFDPIYVMIGWEKVNLITDELPKCRYTGAVYVK